jgi:hypothetical protein
LFTRRSGKAMFVFFVLCLFLVGVFSARVGCRSFFRPLFAVLDWRVFGEFTESGFRYCYRCYHYSLGLGGLAVLPVPHHRDCLHPSPSPCSFLDWIGLEFVWYDDNTSTTTTPPPPAYHM